MALQFQTARIRPNCDRASRWNLRVAVSRAATWSTWRSTSPGMITNLSGARLRWCAHAWIMVSSPLARSRSTANRIERRCSSGEAACLAQASGRGGGSSWPGQRQLATAPPHLAKPVAEGGPEPAPPGHPERATHHALPAQHRCRRWTGKLGGGSPGGAAAHAGNTGMGGEPVGHSLSNNGDGWLASWLASCMAATVIASGTTGSWSDWLQEASIDPTMATERATAGR